MKKIKFFLVVMSLSLLSTFSGFVYAYVSNEIDSIDNLVKKSVKIVKSPSVILVKEITDSGSNQDWVIYDSTKNAEVSAEAHLYIYQKKLISVTINYYSESGDQAKYSEYFFRDNGTIAFIYCNLNSLYGNVKIQTKQYYSTEGKKIKETKEIFNLDSEKPLNKKLIDNPDFSWHKPDVYYTTKAILKEFKYKL